MEGGSGLDKEALKRLMDDLLVAQGEEAEPAGGAPLPPTAGSGTGKSEAAQEIERLLAQFQQEEAPQPQARAEPTQAVEKAPGEGREVLRPQAAWEGPPGEARDRGPAAAEPPRLAALVEEIQRLRAELERGQSASAPPPPPPRAAPPAPAAHRAAAPPAPMAPPSPAPAARGGLLARLLPRLGPRLGPRPTSAEEEASPFQGVAEVVVHRAMPGPELEGLRSELSRVAGLDYQGAWGSARGTTVLQFLAPRPLPLLRSLRQIPAVLEIRVEERTEGRIRVALSLEPGAAPAVSPSARPQSP